MSEDVVLLRLYVTGCDVEAFRLLVERYQHFVYAACLRVTGQAHEAEDAAQECFLALARNAGQISGSISGWLHSTAVNCAKKQIRTAVRQRAREVQAMQDKEHETDAPVWQDLSAVIDGALEEVPEVLRLPLVWHFIEGRAQEEIAEELQVNQSTVSRRIQKGIEELRNILARGGMTLSAAALLALMTEGDWAAEAPATLAAAAGKMALGGVGCAQVAKPPGCCGKGAFSILAGKVKLAVIAVAARFGADWNGLARELFWQPLREGKGGAFFCVSASYTSTGQGRDQESKGEQGGEDGAGSG